MRTLDRIATRIAELIGAALAVAFVVAVVVVSGLTIAGVIEPGTDTEPPNYSLGDR